MKQLVGALALLLCWVGVTAPPAGAAESEPISDLAKVQAYVGPSIVKIRVSWTGYVFDRTNKKTMQDLTKYTPSLREFTVRAQCTGYVVNSDGYIATAGHCVNPNEVRKSFFQQAATWAAKCGCYYKDTTLSPERIYAFSDNWAVRHYDKNAATMKNGASLVEVQTAWSTESGGSSAGKPQAARVVEYQEFKDGDAALLKVDARDLLAVSLSDDDPEVGADVVAVGYPASVDEVTDPDFEPSYKDGSVSSRSSEGDGLNTVYEISAATSGGMSGGPVVNTKGRVLGFVDFKNARETQAFNFMRPSSTLKELSTLGRDHELDEISESYRSGLDAYFADDKVDAVKHLTKVTTAQPENQYAEKYLGLAEKLPDPPPPKKTFPVLPVVLGVVALMLIGLLLLGVFLLLRARRKKSPQGFPPPQQRPYPPPGPRPPYGGPGQPPHPQQPPYGPGQGPGQAPPPGYRPGQAPPPGYRPGPPSGPHPVQQPGQHPGQPPSGYRPGPPSGPPSGTGAPPPSGPPSGPPPQHPGPGQQEQDRRRCGRCGHEADAGSRFCERCGNHL